MSRGPYLIVLKMHLWISWSILRIFRSCCADFNSGRFEFACGFVFGSGIIDIVDRFDRSGNGDLLLLVVCMIIRMYFIFVFYLNILRGILLLYFTGK